ncbi:MAG: Crp/Fnr family transcriptional regulator [Steroidobacteraceae bacterium]|jgi:CRP-like cAMP-binding protein
MVTVKELDRNELLFSLPNELRETLASRLEPLSFADGQVFQEVGTRNSHVIFPLSCIVSMDYVLKDSFSAEFLIVGSEGVIGLETLFEQKPGPIRMVALQGGTALRIEHEELRRRFHESQAIQRSVFQYTYSQIRLMAQTITCNCRHRLDQRMCRWILSVQDRSPSRVIKITHEMMSHFLGVRREAVTNTVGRLQRDGMVEYSRGYLTVVNRAMLENEACECYQAGIEVIATRRLNGQVPRRGCEKVTYETSCWNRQTPLERRR